MKRLSQTLTSWWFTIMVPIHTPMTTLTERENVRKRRLLTLVLLMILILSICYTIYTYLAAFTGQMTVVLIGVGCILFAFFLNRQGYLKLASLTFFFGVGAAITAAGSMTAQSDPLMLLWICFVIIIFLASAGLFVPAWIIFLIAIVTHLFLFWYLLVFCHAQTTRLLSPAGLQNFLILLCMLIYESALVGALYSITTKRALIQADRAVELEQAYHGLEVAHQQLETAHATIQKQALTDALTGLPNHRAVMDQLNRELGRARRYHRSFSLLFFDADHFKRVNDTYGHAAGDTVLCQIGERASSILRDGDTLGRFGGEEFVLLLPETDMGGACMVAERLRTIMAAEPIPTPEVEGGIAMTVSIGQATYPIDGASEQELLTQADEAMYIAKRLGRNQVRTAEEARQMSSDLELITLLQEEEERESTKREGLTLAQLRETYTLKIIYSLLSLLERRDESMTAHAHAVSDLATTIASAMELDSQDVFRIGMAALLHDIGMVAMPDVLLQKTTSLSPQERTRLQEHAELGAQILESSPFLHDLRPAVRHHHERWDGQGYPDQLAGAGIPLAARIIAVAEAYDAMLRDHPYQKAYTQEKAQAELLHCAGTQFDSTVVQTLLITLSSQMTHDEVFQETFIS